MLRDPRAAARPRGGRSSPIERRMLISRALTVVALAIAVTAGMPGCREKGPAEKAGEQVDKAADKLKDAIDDDGPAEKAGKAIDDAVDDLKD